MNRQQRRAQAKQGKVVRSGPPSAPGGAARPPAALVEAMIAHRDGRVRDALAAYERILAADPRQPEALHLSATALLQLDDPGRAIATLRRLVEHHPEHAEGWLNLGSLLREQGRPVEAEAILRRAVAMRPDSGTAFANLAQALRDLGRLDDAEAAVQQALARDPHNWVALAAAGDICRLRQNAGGAIEAYRRAAAQTPDDAGLQKSLASVLVAVGALGEAETVLRRAIGLKPDLVEAHRMLLDLDTAPPVKAADVAALDALMVTLPDGRERIEACFALGNAYDSLGDADRAFPWFVEGNRFKRAGLAYDLGEDRDQAERAIRLFSADFLRARAGLGADSDRPIFVVGMPRSSTTLVEQILASHSAVHGGGELTAIADLVNSFAGGYPEATAQCDGPQWRRLGERYLAEAGRFAPAAAARVTDKMPLNACYLGLIRIILPHARIVQCLRHPIDTCLSCYFKQFTVGQGWAYDLVEVGGFYRHVYRRLMDHWRAVLGEDILDMHQAALIADQEAQTRRLLYHCGLPWEEGCLNYQSAARAVWTVSAAQVRKPLNSKGVARWRRYERHLGPLLAALGPLAEESH